MKVAAVSDVPPNKELYLNRELGVLAFNRRVLAMAEDESIPLLERLKYLCIVSSNMDEFFEIRVSGLQEQIRQNPDFKDKDGLSALETLHRVSVVSQEIVEQQYRLLNESVLPAMRDQGIALMTLATWNEEQAHWARQYFRHEVLPVLTPIGLDPAHPFPRVLNKSLNFAVELTGHDAFGRASNVAIVQAPRALPRLIRMPSNLSGYEHGFVMLTSILQAFIPELFPGMEVHGVYQFRVTRNSDLYVDEEEITNLRVALQGELSQRHFGDAVRLEVSDQTSPDMTARLLKEFGLPEQALYRVNGPVNLVRLMQLPDWVDRPELKFAPFVPGRPDALVKQPDIFKAIQKGDVLLHHPYQSFSPVLEFIKKAATDPDVVAIKQTIYRTGTESVLMESLLAAARSGKEVTVVLELMARFDEEANINWAEALESIGAQVVYGVVGLKTHAKMLLVTRREGRKLRRYGHLSTGNYNVRTARLYTDLSYLTADEETTADMDGVFNHLASQNRPPKLRKLMLAPFHLHRRMLEKIEQVGLAASRGEDARIVAKMNALTDEPLARALAGGGVLARVQEGDWISLDALSGRMELEVSEAELATRQPATSTEELAAGFGLGLFATQRRLVGPADQGATTLEWE